MAKKKDGSLRMCIDYRQLNAVTEVEAYPMPRVDDLIDRLGKVRFISTLDGYWQMPVAAQDRQKTVFVTPGGLFQFKVMPFGVASIIPEINGPTDKGLTRVCCGLSG